MANLISKRYDFVLLFDVKNGNPNGDPDAGNLPRLDPETNLGLVSDVCLKRKIRNYVEIAKKGQPPYRIYVEDGAILNEKHREAYKAVRPEDKKVATEKKLSPQNETEHQQIQAFMCSNFFDIRAFGGVLSTGINAGQVRGPVQIAFATSLEAVLPQEISITRMAATNEKEAKQKQEGVDEDERKENRTMGRKHIVPYGLYRAHGFISAPLAAKTGFSEEDLELLLKALSDMFEHDHSAARGEMSTRKLIVFEHESELGNAHAHKLFDLVKIRRKTKEGHVFEIGSEEAEKLPPARDFKDYSVEIAAEMLPKGVIIREEV